MWPKINDSVRLDVCERYKRREHVKDIAQYHGIHRTSVRNILNAYSIPVVQIRKYELDETFFERIDTEEKAYWVGFIYADGYHYEPDTKIQIGLQRADKGHLEKLCVALKYNGPIINTVSRLKDKEYYGASLTISSKKISNDCKRLGIVQKKSLIIQFPTSSQIPDHLLPHFIRGYFDGDGGIWSGKGLLNVSICGNKLFLPPLLAYLRDNVQVGGSLSFGGSCPTIHFCGVPQGLRLLGWMYDDCNIALDRKINKYNDIKTARNHA